VPRQPDPGLADSGPADPDAPQTTHVRRTIIFVYGETEPGQDMFIRGGIDHAKAKELLGLDCTAANLACAIPITHRNLRNATTAPWKTGDSVLDWYGHETAQSAAAAGTPADWTTAMWSADLVPLKTVATDGFGLEPTNRFGVHYWMIDVDMDCSKAIEVNGRRWFELKTFISNGPGWEADVHQPDAPYASTNHVGRCGEINVFRRGSGAARFYPIGATPPTSYRFIAIGDTGKASPEQWAVARAIENDCRARGCDFALMLGDNIYSSGASSIHDDQFRTKFEEPYRALEFPFYVVLGNHDYGGGGAGNEHWKGQVQIDYTRRSKKWKLPSAYYRWTMVDTDLFALDTTMQMYQLDAAQRATVGQWTSTTTAPWRIAYGHHPYRSNGNHGNAGAYDGTTGVVPWSGDGVKSFLDANICGKVDLYLAGHDHSRQWLTDTCGGATELVVSGAGGSGGSLPGSNPTRFQSGSPGFLAVTVEDRTLTAQFINAKDEIELTRVLTKP
jgi:hypothetical protein